MPSISEKQLIKEIVICLIGCELTLGKFLPPLCSLNLDELILFLAHLEEFRYMNVRRSIPKSVHWLETVLPSEDFGEKRFRQQMRMEPESFFHVLQLIKGTSYYTMDKVNRM